MKLRLSQVLWNLNRKIDKIKCNADVGLDNQYPSISLIKEKGLITRWYENVMNNGRHRAASTHLKV